MAEQLGFAELKQTVLKTIIARRITLGVFAAIALIVILTSHISYLNPLFYAPLVWFLLTFPFKYLIERQRNAESLHWVHAGFFIIEIGIITVLIYLMGGGEWIGIIFYLFTVIYANFFLPELQGYLITGLVIVCYSGLLLLEYTGTIPHHPLFPISGPPYRSLTYNLVTILAGAVGVYAPLAYTVRAFTAIYAQKNRALAVRERELSKLSQRLLTAQDEERRRIARTLHDELGQTLAAVKLEVAGLRDAVPSDRRDAIFAIVDQAIAQTRHLAHSLRPPLLDDLGLAPSLRRLREMVEEASDLKVHLAIDLDTRLPPELEGLLFTAVQEALRNIHAHAHARTVKIAIQRTDRQVTLSVTDDGIGFDPRTAGGLGLRGITERVEGIGGKMVVTSAPGKGTQVKLEVPYVADQSRHRR